jgi:hypothetical protein
MFAEVTSLSVHPDAIDPLIRHFQNTLPEGLAGQRGFAGMLLFTDRQTGQAIALLLWDSEADLLAHCASQHRWPRPAPALLKEPPRSVSYEVSVLVERTEQGALWMHGI